MVYEKTGNDIDHSAFDLSTLDKELEPTADGVVENEQSSKDAQAKAQSAKQTQTIQKESKKEGQKKRLKDPSHREKVFKSKNTATINKKKKVIIHKEMLSEESREEKGEEEDEGDLPEEEYWNNEEEDEAEEEESQPQHKKKRVIDSPEEKEYKKSKIQKAPIKKIKASRRSIREARTPARFRDYHPM